MTDDRGVVVELLAALDLPDRSRQERDGSLLVGRVPPTPDDRLAERIAHRPGAQAGSKRLYRRRQDGKKRNGSQLCAGGVGSARVGRERQRALEPRDEGVRSLVAQPPPIEREAQAGLTHLGAHCVDGPAIGGPTFKLDQP